ncbi:MAG: histidine kinase [Eubacterium sp.]|nr:histidine kinase [Eubacterium sp.]
MAKSIRKKTKKIWEDISLKLKNMALTTRFSIAIVICMGFLIMILSGILFKNMKDNIFKEAYNYMKYEQISVEEAFEQSVNSIHMSVRIFENDDVFIEFLESAARGEKLSASEILDIYEGEINTLTRIVANNPLMYCVRVYGVNDNITEMMSVLYKNNRLSNLNWGKEADICGWHLNYKDAVFSGLTDTDNTSLISYVGVINSVNYGQVGYIESVMRMDEIFPGFYDNEKKDDWAFYVEQNGNIIHGDKWPEEASYISNSITNNSSLLMEKNIKILNIEGRTLGIFTIPDDNIGGTYIGVHDITKAVSNLDTTRNTFVLILLGIMILLWVMIDRLLVRSMLKDFYEILGTIRYVRNKGDLTVRVSENTGEGYEMGELAHQFNRMLDRIEELMKENVEREILIKNAGIKSLQNQINAHFIYNVLESVKMLAEIDEEYLISDSITSLGKMLRYSMKWTSGNVTLGEELEYIDNYIALMNLRNDFKVILSTNIPDVLKKQQIPKMSLQPVVENSILHGIAPIGEDATIFIKVMEENISGRKCVRMEVSDNGAGMSEEELEELRKKIEGGIDTSDKGHGIGLKNVEDRIHLSFGKEYGMSIMSKVGEYTKISFELPYILGGTTNEKNFNS